MGLLRFAIKSSIAGGFLYYTIEEGLWSSPEESLKFYNKIYNNVAPLIQKNVPQEVIQEIHQIPNPSDLRTFIATYWNQGVVTSVKFLSDLPTYTSNGIEWVKKEIEKSSSAISDTSKPAESK